MRHILPAALALLLSVAVSAVHAEVSVGDKAPKFDFKSVTDNKVYTSASLDGWVVAIVFWSTKDEWTFSEDLPLAKIEQDYRLRGVKLLTFNTDETKPRDLALLVIQRKLPFVVASDGKGPRGPVPTAWGIERVPHAFVLGGDGQVAWSAHPSKLPSGIENALQEHPPRLSKAAWTDLGLQLVKEATSWLEEHKNDQDYKGALARLEMIEPGVIGEPAVVAAGKKMMSYFETGNEQDRLSLQTFRQAYPKGARALDSFKAAASVAASQPASRPAELTPADRRAAAAKTKLDHALALEGEKKRIEAYKAFKQVIEMYRNTDEAKTAAEKIKTYEASEEFMAAYRLAETEQEAKSMLAMGRSYRKAGKDELANKSFTEVIAKFPGTKWAEEAQGELSKR